MDPQVSVIIPVYNRANELQNAIQSVLNQSYTNYEIIVVDDGSVNDIVSNYDDKRINIIKHKKNMGVAAARNTGIKSASGEFVAFLDSDDRWKSDKLSTQLAFMGKYGYKASCTGFSIKRYQKDDTKIKSYKKAYLDISDMVWGCHVSPGSTFLGERKIFGEIGDFDNDFSRYEDWDWLLRFCNEYRLGLLDKVLVEITMSGIPNDDAIRNSLYLVKNKHRSKLNFKYAKCLDAAIMIENAAQAYRKGNLIKALYYLFYSCLTYPVNNKALNEIVIQRILFWKQ